jgi:MGT family glycosyltransferase
MNLGLICPEVAGHLNPITTLGRELQRRGHGVSVMARPDARRRTEAAGLNYVPVGEQKFPLGSEQAVSAELGKLRGLRAIRFTVEQLRQGAEVILTEGPGVVRREKFDALVVDQVAAAGGTLADILGLPHVTVCNALPLTPDLDEVPTAMSGWPFASGLLGKVRDALGYLVIRWIGHPLIREIDRHRRANGLPRMKDIFGGGSALAQIAQQPAFFDFPRPGLSANFHYTGPWHDEGSADAIPFPWEKLDGRPLIYASMGTLQNRLEFIFSAIAEACAELDAQLVIALGSRGQNADALAATLPGHPIVVSFAPQLALLDKAALVITHAGLNTALESLSRGLAMAAIPIANDQPGVASRLAWLGVAEVVQLNKLNAARLRAALLKLLNDPRYRENARNRQEELRRIDGVRLAADLIEKAFSTKAPVLRQPA